MTLCHPGLRRPKKERVKLNKTKNCQNKHSKDIKVQLHFCSEAYSHFMKMVVLAYNVFRNTGRCVWKHSRGNSVTSCRYPGTLAHTENMQLYYMTVADSSVNQIIHKKLEVCATNFWHEIFLFISSTLDTKKL